MGAIAPGGIRILNKDVVESLGIPRDVLDAVASHEQLELERREREYRDSQPPVDVLGKTVILVDDGIATGATISAAVAALRNMKAARIVIAVPTASREAFAELSRRVDAVIAVMVPEEFYGVGQWYEDFSQTTDSEVRDALAHARKSIPSYGTLFELLRKAIAPLPGSAADYDPLISRVGDARIVLIAHRCRRESSDRILLDDNFASIVAAVEEGRAVFRQHPQIPHLCAQLERRGTRALPRLRAVSNPAPSHGDADSRRGSGDGYRLGPGSRRRNASRGHERAAALAFGASAQFSSSPSSLP